MNTSITHETAQRASEARNATKQDGSVAVPVPSEWEFRRISEIVAAPITDGPHLTPRFTSEGVPFLSVNNLVDSRIDTTSLRYISLEDHREYSRKCKPQKWDVLIGKAASVGKVAIVDVDWEFNIWSPIALIRVGAPHLPLYIFYAVQAPAVSRQIEYFTNSSSQGNIGMKDIGRLVLGLPPPDEQGLIAEALSDVDGLLASLDALIAKKRAIKQAAMQQLLTGRTRLPGFSSPWVLRQLGEHVRYLRTGSYSRAELTSGGPTRYLHYGDIHTTGLVSLDPTAQEMPSLPTECARALDRLRDGDLVFVDASEDLDGVGKSVEIAGTSRAELVAGLHTIAARFDKSVLVDGFKGFLQFCPAFRQHLRRLAAGTKVYATNRGHISSANVPLPPLAEQLAIATVLSDMVAEIAALEREHDKTRQIKQGMMQQLLTGRTRLVKPTEVLEASA